MLKKMFVFCVALSCVSILSAKNVQVSVTPTDAIVILKGKVVQPVSPGLYSIAVGLLDQAFTAQADGYDSEQFIINLKTPAAIQIDLKPNRKQVSVTCSPETADIYVNGRLMGKSPIDFNIHKGEQKSIMITADGYDKYIKTIGFYDQPGIKMSYNLDLVENRRNITVLVDAPAAEFYANGVLIVKGKSSATFPIYKDQDVQLVVRAEGYLEYSRIIQFQENVSSYNLTQDMVVDAAYAASEPGADIANKRMEIMVRKSMKRDEAIQRMKYYISELFETLEINDNVSGWYRTAWNQDTFSDKEISDKIVRSRIEIKEIPDNGDGQLKFKLLLQSQVSTKIDQPKDEDFHAWGRVMKKYKKLLEDIKNLVE